MAGSGRWTRPWPNGSATSWPPRSGPWPSSPPGPSPGNPRCSACTARSPPPTSSFPRSARASSDEPLMSGQDGLLVSPGDLAGREAPVLLDVRWRLGGPPGIDSYQEGHLPGAVFVDLDRDLAGP